MFTPSEDLIFCGFICGGQGIEAGISVDLVHLFDIWITLCFVGLGFICDLDFFTMKVLISSLN